MSASDPMFSTLEDTHKRQRLDNLDAAHNVLDQLDHVVDSVRGEFYTRLGLSRLTAVLASTVAQPPVTESDYLHLLSTTTEQKMIRKGLLSILTALLKSGGGGRIQQEWNDTAAFRNMSRRDVALEQEKLAEEIDNAFRFISGESTPGSAPRVKAMTVGSLLKDQYRVVGNSLRAVPPYMFHFSLDSSNE